MVPFFRKLSSFNTVAAGSTATLNLPLGPTYYTLALYCLDGSGVRTAAEIAADINFVVLKVNGTERTRVKASDLQMLHKYYGGTVANDGVLHIDLSPFWAQEHDARDNLAWGTGNVDVLTLEVELASGSGITTMTAHADMVMERRELGLIIQRRRMVWTPGSTGTQEWADLPKGIGSLTALHFDESGSAVVDDIEVEVDGVRMQTSPEAVIRAALTSKSERVPQTDVIHFETTRRKRMGEYIALRDVQDFRVYAEIDTAGAVPIVIETINAPLGLIAAAA